ncbi:septum formation initiator family protein [Bacillus sp. BPN334]|uniref:FtsB family cell division protein n=1 Tax=Bacillus sp. BPN334 TaxID=2217815 RepID=UPI0011EBC9CF|nr:hypothetical protein [Bacillus sp. BPN334]KAA0781239.1 hypothetical protein DN393_29935 [Bacillus sp. BPN334]
MKQLLQIGSIVALGITSLMLWSNNTDLKGELKQQKVKLTAEIKELKSENKELEERVQILKENTEEKGQEVAKHFVETLMTYDSNDKERKGLEELRKLVKGEAEKRLFNSEEDMHKQIDNAAIHYITKANVKDMYYTRSAEDKADVTVNYEYVIQVAGEEKRETHSMKLSLVLEGDNWFVENYDFKIQNGTEGP